MQRLFSVAAEWRCCWWEWR